MIKKEAEFEKAAESPDCRICIAAELYVPSKGEPVLSLLPAISVDGINADISGFKRAVERVEPYMRSLGCEPEPAIFDMIEFTSPGPSVISVPESEAEIIVGEADVPYAEASVGGASVSHASVNDISSEDGKVEIYVETEERYRGRGFATACVAALRDYLVKKGKSVKYITDADNAPSLKVAEKAGFEEEGRRLTAVFYK